MLSKFVQLKLCLTKQQNCFMFFLSKHMLSGILVIGRAASDNYTIITWRIFQIGGELFLSKDR